LFGSFKSTGTLLKGSTDIDELGAALGYVYEKHNQ